ncbi:unnamed protein product, partial [marine sediment metagenome]
VSDPSTGLHFTMLRGGGDHHGMRIYSNRFEYYGLPGWVIISGAPTPIAGQWYHIKHEFRNNGAPAYKGLSEGTFKIYIDDIPYGAYSLKSPDVDVSFIKLGGDGVRLNYINHIDAVDYSWSEGYYEGRNENPLLDSALLNFTTTIDFNLDDVQSNDTIDAINLYYSHKTNVSADISFSLFNFNLSQWDVVNLSDNSAGFYDNYVALNSSYYNATNCVKVKYYGNSTAPFELYIEKLVIETNCINYTTSLQFDSSLPLEDIDLIYSLQTDIIQPVNIS